MICSCNSCHVDSFCKIINDLNKLQVVTPKEEVNAQVVLRSDIAVLLVFFQIGIPCGLRYTWALCLPG